MFKFVIALLLVSIAVAQDPAACEGTSTCGCCCYSGGTIIRASFDDVGSEMTISSSAPPITLPTGAPTGAPTASRTTSSTDLARRDDLDEGEVCIEAADFSAFLDPETQDTVFRQTCCEINVNSMCVVAPGAGDLNVAEENILIGDIVALLVTVNIGVEQGELLDVTIGASDEIIAIIDPAFEDPDAIRTAQTALNILAESGAVTVTVGGVEVQIQPCAARESDLGEFPTDGTGKLIPQILECDAGNTNVGSGAGALDNCIPTGRMNGGDCDDSSTSKSGKKSKCTSKKSKKSKSEKSKKSKSKKSKSKKKKGNMQFAIAGMKTAESAALVAGIMFVVSGVATFFIMQRRASFTPLADVEVESPPVDEKKPLLE